MSLNIEKQTLGTKEKAQRDMKWWGSIQTDASIGTSILIKGHLHKSRVVHFVNFWTV